MHYKRVQIKLNIYLYSVKVAMQFQQVVSFSDWLAIKLVYRNLFVNSTYFSQHIDPEGARQMSI